MIKPERLRITNFKVIESADVLLRDRGLVGVMGVNTDTHAASSNGSGKTTLYEAISWCVFGEVAVHGRLTDQVIRNGTDAAEVVFAFSDDEKMYEVTRKRTKRGGTLTLTVDGAPVNGRTQSDTQATIIETLGLDWPSFRNTVLYGQGDLGRFADRETTDADRKAILKRILRLERFDEALTAVKKERSEIAKLRQEYDRKLHTESALYNQTEATLAQAKRRDAGWDTDWQSRRRALRRSMEDFAKEVDDATAKAATIERIERLEANYQANVDANPARRLLAEHRSKLQQLERACTKAEQRYTDEIARPIKHAEYRIQEITSAADKGICYACKQSLNDKHGVEEELGELRAEIKVLIGRGKDLGVEIYGMKQEFSAAKDHESQLLEAVTEAEQAEADLRKVRELLREARTAGAIIAMVAIKRAKFEAQVQQLEGETNPYTEQVANLTAELVADMEGINAAQAQIEILNERDAPLVFWEQGFGNKGLPSFIMDSVLPMLNASAARYLQTLSDGDLSVELSSTTDLKSGDSRESISIKVTAEGAEATIPSGAQWRKISLAVDLALMDLVASREGSRIDALFLDEVLDGLDPVGKARVVQLLRELRETRSTILVVSHDELIAEQFSDQIIVTKKGGKARVEG